MKTGVFRKVLMTSLSAALLVGMLAGCNSTKSAESKEDKVLRIGMLYGGYDDSWFRQQYTDIFEFANKNVKIEIVPAIDQSQYRYMDRSDMSEQPDNLESIKKIMTGDNPVDVVVADTATMKQLIQENLVKQLDPLIQEDKFDTSDYVPAVIDGIKDLGEGKIYGLTPSFSSSALFYNKKIFADAGVEPPSDRSTWDEVFDKARLVSKGEGKDRVYGFSFNRYSNSESLFWDVQTYVNTLQLKIFDDKAEKMLVNTKQWADIWGEMAKLSKDKIIPDANSGMNQSGEWNPVGDDLFLSGKVAMTVAENYYINEIADANKHAANIKNFKPVDWDIVTVPVHPEKPDIGGNLYLNNLFSINSSAANPETAWEFIRFINDKEFAQIKSRSNTYEMNARKSYIQPKQGLDYNIQAFYLLKPLPPTSLNLEKLMMEKPGLHSVTYSGRPHFMEVMQNKKTPEEALKEWEEKGNKMLQAIKNDPKTDFMEDGTPIPREDTKQ